MSNDLGLDRSGNNNNWTVNNISYVDQMLDSPTNNFATIDPLSSGAGVFAEGNLKYTSTADTGVGTLGISSGKAYFEVTISSTSNSHIGICDIGKGINPLRGGNWSDHGGITYKQNGDQYRLPAGGGSSTTASYGASYTNGDIIGVALDVDNNTIKFYKNNVSQGNTAQGPSFISSSGVYSIMIYGGGTVFTANFGQDSSFAGAKTSQGNQDSNDIGDFYYTPPNLFLSLCTSNLPDVDVVPSKNFNAVAYTGTGSNQVVTGVGFQPDFLWLKNRSLGYGHKLFDVLRGLGSANPGSLSSDAGDAEGTFNYINAVSNDGFTTVSQQYSTNNPGSAIVAWNWKANGSGSSNTAGSINSTVSVNNDAGFSIVSYTGNGTAGATVGHGLSKAPEMWIIKNRNASGDWVVWHKDLGNQTKNLYLDATAAIQTEPPPPGIATIPSSTLVSLGTFPQYNGNNQNIIMYAFHSVDGYSKVGSYTGNGVTNGPFVYTGFRPAFVLTKVTNAADDWSIADYSRSPNNVADKSLRPNSVAAEDSAADIDILSNGFKVRQADSHRINYSGDTFIYIAFAETPFKYSNAR